ncbi:MAG: cell division protein FtsL [Gammaproteobacteria bacterium]
MSLAGRRVTTIAIPLLWAAVLASAAGAVWFKHRSRELFVELESLNRTRDQLDIEYGKLQLEQSSWSTHAFVENAAATNLKMGQPPPAQVEVVSP